MNNEERGLIILLGRSNGLVLNIRKKEKKNEDLHKSIYKEFYQKVLKTAFYVTKDPDLAQDVLQETFIKAFNQLDQLIDKNKIEAWLMTITTRTAIDMIRRLKNWSNLFDDTMYLLNDLQEKVNNRSVSKIVEEKIIFETISKHILDLKPEYREVLVLKIIHDLKDEEIASSLQIRVGTVKSRIHRGKMQLRSAIQSDPELLGGEYL